MYLSCFPHISIHFLNIRSNFTRSLYVVFLYNSETISRLRSLHKAKSARLLWKHGRPLVIPRLLQKIYFVLLYIFSSWHFGKVCLAAIRTGNLPQCQWRWSWVPKLLNMVITIADTNCLGNRFPSALLAIISKISNHCQKLMIVTHSSKRVLRPMTNVGKPLNPYFSQLYQNHWTFYWDRPDLKTRILLSNLSIIAST
jgi:hypothetical protein